MPGSASIWSLVALLMSIFCLSGVLLELVLDDAPVVVVFPVWDGLDAVLWASKTEEARARNSSPREVSFSSFIAMVLLELGAWLRPKCYLAGKAVVTQLYGLLARASKSHRPEEAQIGNLPNEIEFLRVLQEKLQPSVVFAVEIVVNVLREVLTNVVRDQVELRRPLLRDGDEVLWLKAVISRTLEYLSQIDPARLPAEGSIWLRYSSVREITAFSQRTSSPSRRSGRRSST